jgi:hypothetical protein
MDGALEWAVVDKKPVPEIDFTLHTMEDGTQVSTQEGLKRYIPKIVKLLYLLTRL